MSVSVLTSYRFLISSNQNSLAVDSFVAALRYAQIAAMSDHAIILFCPRGANDQCGSNWQKGQWIINKTTHEILRAIDPIFAGSIEWRSSLHPSNYLEWLPDGFTNGQQGSFYICNATSGITTQIIVLRTGRLRYQKGYFSNGCQRDHSK